MAQYTVEKVSAQEPREWKNPQGGIVYYIKVQLSGHAKPVSIGKKSPDALKVGDTVYGTITETDLPEDKFKAEQKPFGGSASAPRYQPKDEHAIAKAVALKAAVDWVSDDSDVDYTLSVANDFLRWLESDSKQPDAVPIPSSGSSEPLPPIPEDF